MYCIFGRLSNETRGPVNRLLFDLFFRVDDDGTSFHLTLTHPFSRVPYSLFLWNPGDDSSPVTCIWTRRWLSAVSSVRFAKKRVSYIYKSRIVWVVIVEMSRHDYFCIYKLDENKRKWFNSYRYGSSWVSRHPKHPRLGCTTARRLFNFTCTSVWTSVISIVNGILKSENFPHKSAAETSHSIAVRRRLYKVYRSKCWRT